MKTFHIKPVFLTLVIAVMVTYSAIAQRVIKGTVYREGKAAAGVTVESQKTNEIFRTSFDGNYEINIPEKCKYLRFTFINDSRKLDIENNTSNVIDFSFDGIIPVAAQITDARVILKTSVELIADKDKQFMSFYTLEKRFYDQKDYKSAIGPWRKLSETYPKSTVNIYLHGLNMYQNLIEGTTDRKLKDIYIDTLMQIYDKRIKYFDQKGFNLGRQGADYLKYTLDNKNLTDNQKKSILKKGYNYLDESIQLQNLESENIVLFLLMQSTRGLYGMGEFDKEKVIENYDIVTKILNNHLAKQPVSADLTNIRDLVDQVFQSSGAADCEALISIYEPKFDQIASNLDDLKKMVRMLDRQNCDASPLFAKASEKLFALEQSSESAYNMAHMYVKTEKLDKAQTYYKLAIESEKEPLTLSKYYLELAHLNFATPQVAKTYAKKSIENNPNLGKAYILLGDIYAHNSKSYGENDFERSVVFLLAVDYYSMAKKVDSSVEADANEKISLYSQYFPTKEDIFFNGLTVGKTFKLGGWIGETTVIREKK